MLIKVAWRNIWRNKLRSSVVVIAIILGIWGGLFLLALNNAFVVQRIDTVVDKSLSHIQIHHTDFPEDNNIAFFIPSVEEITGSLDKNDIVKAYSARMVLNAMVSSATGGYGAKVTGINPEQESEVTSMSRRLIEGAYLKGVKKNPVLIGRRLANKLKVKMRSKVVVTFQNIEGDIVAGAFRIAGIYETVDAKYDEMNLFVLSKDIRKLLERESIIHEIAILVQDFEQVDGVKNKLEDEFPDLSVRSWGEVAPELGYYNDVMSQYMYFFVGIIMLALAFGIVNTMLMAVLERKRELGMLMSVGMNKTKVFLMIMLETLWLSMAGGPLGILLSFISITYFNHVGIDLSIIGEGLNDYGVSAILHPILDNEFYINITFMVLVIAFLASIYPAIKALKLKPAEAVRVL